MDGTSEGFDLMSVLNAGSDAPAEHDSPEPDDSPEPEVEFTDAETDAPEPETESAEPAPEADPLPQAPAPLDWSHPELAAFKQQYEAMQPQVQFLNRVQQQLAEAQSLQARQEIENTIMELSDGDMDRHSRLLSTIASITQPLSQQTRAHEQRATGAEKQLSAFVLAAEELLTPEQWQTAKRNFDAYMQADGPQVMARLADASKSAQSKYDPVIQQLQQKNAELEKRLAAQASLSAKRATGVTRIDNGGQPSMAGTAATKNGAFDLNTFMGWDES